MSSTERQLHLNLFILNTGHHEASWRHRDTLPRQAADVHYYKRLAQTAERGLLDSLFLSDAYGLPPTIRYKVLQGLEPFTLLSALAVATERIGLIGTASTTYNEPFHIARKFASLDHISGGRTGWNIVTSTGNTTAFNFRDEGLPRHEERYERADEFVEVVRGLWDSWEDDALAVDKAAGIYVHPDRLHPLNHKGKFFAVRGPLNIPRPPQGHPLLVQAGASDTGKEFAAKVAEAVFTAQNTLEDGRLFYADLKSRMRKYGRQADQLKVLPGFCAIIGDTEAEAREREAELHGLTQAEYGVYRLSNLFKIDLSVYPLDGPLPYDALPETAEINSQKGRHQLYLDMARREGLTIRDLIMRTASSRGHYAIAGTPLQIADEMERWFRTGAADGFNLMPPYLPGGLDDFVDKVVPELQNRGLFRTEYTGLTLRDHYGLARPSWREYGREHASASRSFT
ncbi:LLM class flavin-dependent oxidoreductase [Paenibacillus oenotherae]|uniref:LLM class flavin-dependent oxidoreductase n=1 Tax=Paenibacillus oenotherae TaxID=1435645 RepID=A0ABS7D0I6_9BACL|nr:LLM class flavin-dependent oxidoreductase [Paenibacillus oenotherae]MBW7473370.1 LLM class flavin-dependent oxidoreductase [Paenibacillus oenotherae]